MIIGHGDIATLLNQHGYADSPRLFFAAGVSNSRETRESEYQREINLLLSQDKAAHLVYFSTLSVFYARTRYTQHKALMEAFVRSKFASYTLVRLGNITWGHNPHTLINYLRAHPDAEIRDEWRYIVTPDEFLHWLNLIPDWPCEVNIPGQRMKVADVYEKYVIEERLLT